ncbi:MAG: DNA polymerase Y family protein [Nitrospira sp.]
MERQIVCFAIPSLEVALARLHTPQFRTRPLAIAPLNSPRALLREVSSEAAREGIHVGMPLERARRLCPSLHICSPNPSQVATADQSLLSVIRRYAPAWEPCLPGAVMMDLTGTTRLFGSACDVAANVQQDVLARYQLEGVAGVGSNKLVAQTASTLVEPSELYDVRQGSERLFMSPLSVRALPGVHRPCMRATLKRLDDLNLRSLGDVADSPLDALEIALGDYAGELSRWAQGIDPTPVFAPAVHPSLADTITLSPDEVDDAQLLGRLLDGLQRLCRTLRAQRRMCGGLCLTIRYSDQRELTTKARVVPETCWEIDLSRTLETLFQRAFRRRIRLRLMTLSLTHLAGFAEQGSLFDERPPTEQKARDRAHRLAIALDQLHERFGDRAIRYGRTH